MHPIFVRPKRTMTSRLFGKELLISLLLFGTVGMALGAGTWAYLSDTDASTGNAVDGATFDLKLDGGDTLPAVLSIPDAVPGDTASANITITNAGPSSADHVEVEFLYSENDGGATEPDDPDLSNDLNENDTAAHVQVTQLEYRDGNGDVLTDILSGVSDDNGNGIVDLHDLQVNQPSLDDLQPPGANGGSPTYLVVSLSIANDDGSFSGSDEDLMADGIDFEIRVTLNQHSSQ